MLLMNHTAKLDGTHICNATMKLAVLLMPQMCYLLLYIGHCCLCVSFSQHSHTTARTRM